MAAKEVTRLLYRSLLRWAKAAEDVPFTVRSKHLAEVYPQFAAVELDLQNATAVRQLTQTSFRDSMSLEGADASEALDAGLTGLRILNTFYADQIKEMRSMRSLHLECNYVKYPVGQVFIHRRHGYRGVIVGWDPTCGREPEWAQSMALKHDQPFYQALPDEDDCQRLYGGTRITKYVAEENVMPITVPRRVTHRLLEHFFMGYSPSTSRYVPKEHVKYQYPDDYNFSDSVSCREDTNLLKSLSDSPSGETLPQESQTPLQKSMAELEKVLAAMPRQE